MTGFLSCLKKGRNDVIEKNERDLQLRYLMAVGTPFPVGERLLVKGKYREVVGFDFKDNLTLEIILDNGDRLTESIEDTDKVREKYIRKFLEDGKLCFAG